MSATTSTTWPGGNLGNSRNGTRPKTVFTAIGPVQIEVPRDREGSFEPQIVRKRQRRLDGIDAIVLSLTARGLTTGEVAAHFADVYGATVSKDTLKALWRWLDDSADIHGVRAGGRSEGRRRAREAPSPSCGNVRRPS
jgi:hypothetical protein